MSKISVTQGDSYNFTVTVKDSDGVIFDLSGYSMTMTVKDDIAVDDSAAKISATATISTPASGIGSFALTPTDTDIPIGAYLYDVQISDGVSNVYTVIKKSTFEITDQVTLDI